MPSAASAPPGAAVGRLAGLGRRGGLGRRKQRHRPDLLRHAVFFDLEVGGRQVQDRVAAPVAHHDVHQDGRGIGLDDARRALRGRGLLLRDERRSKETDEDDRDPDKTTHENLSPEPQNLCLEP